MSWCVVQMMHMQGILEARLLDGHVDETTCPQPDCHGILPLLEAERLLSSSRIFTPLDKVATL